MSTNLITKLRPLWQVVTLLKACSRAGRALYRSQSALSLIHTRRPAQTTSTTYNSTLPALLRSRRFNRQAYYRAGFAPSSLFGPVHSLLFACTLLHRTFSAMPGPNGCSAWLLPSILVAPLADWNFLHIPLADWIPAYY